MPRAWRMRAWPSDATVAHLIFVDHQAVPTADDVADAVAHAARRGARAVRTSAMFPSSAEIVLAAGFEPIDRLALLSRPLGGSDRIEPDGRVRNVRPWQLAGCARVDRDAFGLLWGNTPTSLRDIQRATPGHASRLVRVDRQIAGFAISGAAGDTGYLQRLAVATDHRRRGLARLLVGDALGWMTRRGMKMAMVNTGVDNDAALALYETTGFERLAVELVIGELHIV